jgi:uncharacterized Fe-S cluster protein YjdI
MENKICTISFGKNSLDNDYTFYENGKIEHYYDKHPTKHSITDWLKPNQISEQEKEKIIEKCPAEFKTKINNILSSK